MCGRACGPWACLAAVSFDVLLLRYSGNDSVHKYATLPLYLDRKSWELVYSSGNQSFQVPAVIESSLSVALVSAFDSVNSEVNGGYTMYRMTVQYSANLTAIATVSYNFQYVTHIMNLTTNAGHSLVMSHWFFFPYFSIFILSCCCSLVFRLLKALTA